MKKILMLVAVPAALAVPSTAMAVDPPVPTSGPAAGPACRAEVISYAVQVGTGRREAADFFFGDYPQAVRDAEFFLQTACAS
jgi:hypothetical protein